MKIEMPSAVKEIISRLCADGYSAYAVGGCVRDTIMGKTPSDWDICTSALPQETLKTLGKENIVENGIKHGTVTVRVDNENYEITTFRTDGKYIDNRRPETVTFVRSLKEDLARRDFTVNAIAYNDTDGLCDDFGGITDIHNKIIRCVGNPDQRFHEDALRILRAIRFSSRLGFEIEEKTSESIHQNVNLLLNISAERIFSELVKILTGDNVEKVLLQYSDVLSVFIPEIKPMIGLKQRNPHHIYDVWTHTVKAVAAIRNERILRLAALFHDFGKPKKFTVDRFGTGHFKGHPELSAKMTDEILTRLKCDNKTKTTVMKLIEMHDVRTPPEPKYVRRSVAKIGVELYPELLELKRADTMAQNPATIPEKLQYLRKLQEIYTEEISKNTAFSVKALAVNGNDIKQLGITNGRKIGECLNRLYSLVIDGEAANDKEQLLSKIAELYKISK